MRGFSLFSNFAAYYLSSNSRSIAFISVPQSIHLKNIGYRRTKLNLVLLTCDIVC
ncbi:MAG: hypothetical protein JWP38_3709 [Herbaspirillum sp.]|nr:hypothetical protein [Herbaspirillum sp.]